MSIVGNTLNAPPVLVACTFVRPAITGRSATGVTVKLKVLVSVLSPSLAVKVIVAEPLILALGVSVMVRLVPEPPNVRPAASIKLVLLDEAASTRLAGAVSESVTTNAILVVPSSDMVLAVMSAMTGA